MKKLSLLLIMLTFILSAFPQAQASGLGTAGDYSAFIYGDLNVWGSDMQGRAAAGGNINIGYPGITSGYTVGDEADPSDFSIVGGADVNFYRGSIHNGGIFAEGNVYLDHYSVYGDVVANGGISDGPGSGTIVSPGTANPNAGAVSPIDFDVEFDYLKWVSGSLSSTTANGTTNVQYYNSGPQITFTGTDDINIFSLNGSDLNGATNVFFNIGDNVAIVNVSGTIDNFMALGISGYAGKQQNILYNFYEAETMTIQNIGVKGSILAPHADVNFNSAHIDGTLIANSLTGTGEFHDFQFDHDVPVVPEPVSSTLFLIGGATLGFRSLRKKKRTD